MLLKVDEVGVEGEGEGEVTTPRVNRTCNHMIPRSGSYVLRFAKMMMRPCCN
jgi:hypothetical protein